MLSVKNGIKSFDYISWEVKKGSKTEPQNMLIGLWDIEVILSDEQYDRLLRYYGRDELNREVQIRQLILKVINRNDYGFGIKGKVKLIDDECRKRIGSRKNCSR